MNKKSPLYVLGFMVTICIVFGSAISIVYNLTQKTTRQNEVLNRNRTIAEAFGLPVSSNAPEAYETAVKRGIEHSLLNGTTDRWEVFIRKEPPRDIGFVFKGIGFWDVISGILVLSPDLSSIVGIRFLEQHETPGLGARIEEPWFYRQFTGKMIAWDAESGKKIIIGQGRKEQQNRVDAITGATQTSMALMRILNRDLNAFRKAYEAQKDGSTDQPEGAFAWH
jgi:Na+-transporting NADH:ubiquinone oxidoreductase subunit C